MNNFTDRLRKVLDDGKKDTLLDFAERIIFIAFGLSVTGFVIILVRVILKLSG